MTMQAEHVNDELLQRHFDGDLDAAQSAGLEAHLSQCVPCAARRKAFGRLANMIHAAALDSASGVDFNAMFQRIERGIDAEAGAKTPATTQGARVIPMRKRSPVLSVLTAASAGLAVAAAVLLMVYDPGSPARPGTISDGALPAAAPAKTSAPSAVPPASSEVVEVDFGTSTGTVFDIALADGSSTPVVWINDDE
jgi:anti-sigma factor RsiW